MKKFLIAGVLALSTALAAGGASAQKLATAIFAGGCFWCVESDFDHVPGVVKTVSGYTGGKTDNPTYKQVTYGDTGHREAVEITYDPSRISYEKLLTVFWHSVDPTDGGGQFCDRGVSYRSAIFVQNDDERRLAEDTRRQAEKDLKRDIATTVETASAFYPAEDYHQDYYTKNPLRYKLYRWNCGRDQRVRELWGDKAYMGIPKSG